MNRRTMGAPAARVLLAACMLGAGCSQDTTTPEETADDAACETESGDPLPTAPLDQRVDLDDPSFSNPTAVTNALFPVSGLRRVVMLGAEDGQPFRSEVTLLSTRRTIEWDGRELEALVSQYAAFVDGRIAEVAIDLYAQADDGSVWYLGEDVSNYEDGVVADMEGTWHAGEEGPGAMIMPADPRKGNVWRPENICGVVFEEVTATATDVTVTGPRGTVDGAITVRELHDDATYEEKTFAPGYGEFFTGSGPNVEALALAVPTDSLPGSLPGELDALSTRAQEAAEAARNEAWDDAASAMTALRSSWTAYAATGVPTLLASAMDEGLDALEGTIDESLGWEAREAALEVERIGLDFQLQYRPVIEVDRALVELWTRRLLLDLEVDDWEGVAGDIATLRWLRDRVVEDGTSDRTALGQALEGLRLAFDRRDADGVRRAAQRLRDALAGRAAW